MKIANSVLQPVISVVLPVFNGGSYLHSSVHSVLQQNYPHFELLILDDCSTDNSWEWIQQLTDQRIRIFKNEENKGLFYNLNFLINQSSTTLIKLWAQDDIMYPECLQAFVQLHQEFPNLGFSYSGRDIIDDKGEILHKNGVDNTPQIISTQLHTRIAYFTGSIAGNISNTCINKNALSSVGLFNVHMKISADFDMWVRLAKEHETGFIRQALIQLRDHSGQLSRNEDFFINHVREDLQVYRYLNSYASKESREEGVSLMRNHKLLFYYTLMVKALMKGKFKTALAYYKELSSYDNFWVLSYCFFKSRILKPKKPALHE